MTSIFLKTLFGGIIYHVRKKVISMVGVLNRFGSTLNCDTRSKVFCVFVKPHLLFALPVWGNADTGNITAMGRTILQAARIIPWSLSATLGKETAAALDIIPFKFLTFKYNVLKIFNFLSSNEILYYLYCDLLSKH